MNKKYTKIEKLFNPNTIAVIGATDREYSVGKALMDNLVENNFKGFIYPINPNREKVKDIKTYPNINEVNNKIDLAIIATPANTIPFIMEECGQTGVENVVIISAGFGELGDEGIKLSNQILNSAKKYNIRILGPNCLGFISPKIGLNASFANKMALSGNIAFISQSGALCTAMLDWSVKNNIGFSYFISIGAGIDIGFCDLIDYLNDDLETTSILIYMESLKDGRRFVESIKKVTLRKPIIILKSGNTSDGSSAVKSHTGNLSGNDIAYDSAFEKTGVIRIKTINDFFGITKLLSIKQLPKDNKIAIITNAGGPGVIATDFLSTSKCNLASLSKKTIQQLSEFLPDAWSHSNPIDILGDAKSEQYKDAIKVCMQDNNVSAVLVILTPQSMTNPTKVAEEIYRIKKSKILIAVWMGGDDVLDGKRILENNNIPVYDSPEEAIQSFSYIYDYVENTKIKEKPFEDAPDFKMEKEENRKIIQNVINEKRSVLTEYESKNLLANYDIPVPTYDVAKSAHEAKKIAKKIGFPVVMKILSPDIIHKTDVGGVEININSKKEAKNAYNSIIKNIKEKKPNANIHGVFIEKMISKKYELIIGSNKDPVFGNLITFGYGGTTVEIFRDTKTVLAPLTIKSALKMIKNTKVYKVLKGYRGEKPVDIYEIQFLLYKFSRLLNDFPQIKECDMNPFSIDQDSGIVLDAKIILE